MKSSPKTTARLAGALYLISAVPAGFSVSVFLRLVVRGDAAATAANILGAESMFRLALAAEISGIVCFVFSWLLLYELFEPASRRLARAMMVMGLIGATIQSLDSLCDLATLLLLKGGGRGALGVDQARALAHVALRMHLGAYGLALVFFGVGSLMIAALIRRSSYLPRIFGALMAIDGLGYLLFSFASFVSPPLASRLSTFLPYATAIIGEASLMLWLVVKGVDARRWEEQAASA